MSTPNVAFIHPQLARIKGEYDLIQDCISGSDAVKAKRQRYLPMPNAADTSPANKARYDAYLTRAVYYNVPRRTLHSLVGQVFAREPIVEVPTALQPIIDDATGSGISTEQEAKRLMSYALAYSRGGVMVDYPDTGEEGASRADLDSGRIRPLMMTYGPKSIINWRVMNDGARTRLSLVVLAESWPFADDGFEIKSALQFKVLRLVPDGVDFRYVIEYWREDNPTIWGNEDVAKFAKTKQFKLQTEAAPCDTSGEPIRDILFTFIGSENNDTDVDLPPFTDLCNIAISHYRDSADYQESCFQMGQPTFWFSGITKDHWENVLNGQISLGSRGGLPLPEGGNAGVLTAPANSMPFESMQMKERQMVALGAKLVEQKTVQRTATEATQDEAAETSVLATCARNVSSAIEQALKWCMLFIEGSADTKVRYELNDDFDAALIDSADRTQVMNEYNGGLIAFTEARTVLRKAGIATLTDEDALAEIAKQKEESIAQAQAMAAAMNVGNTTDDNDDKAKSQKDDDE